MAHPNELTDKQQQVYDILAKHGRSMGPTDIGVKAGKPYYNASAWASGALKALIKFGLVQRHDGGMYSLVEDDNE